MILETALEMCLRIFRERASVYHKDYITYCDCGDDVCAQISFNKMEIYDNCYTILSVALRDDIELLKQYDYFHDYIDS